MTASAFPERAHALQLLRDMTRIRRFEEVCAQLPGAARIHGFAPLSVGTEATVTGTMRALRPDDGVVATHREHEHALVREVPARELMAELLGRVEGCCRGRGGAIHVFDAARRFYGSDSAIAGGWLPVSVGLALADQLAGRTDRVTACCLGDGAVAEGRFHESVNLAALWRLPLLFVCEVARDASTVEAQPSPALKAASYDLPTWRADGMDVLDVEAAVRRGAGLVRGGEGPAFVELHTPRLYSHARHDPLTTFSTWLRSRGWLDSPALQELEQAVAAEMADAYAYSQAGTPEPIEELTRFTYAEAS